jgi:hypothetical protein
VLRTALQPYDSLGVQERRFLDTYARITGYGPLESAPHPIWPREVVIEGAHQRKRLVQLAAIATLFNRPVRMGSVLFLKHLANHLQTRDPVIDVIEALHKGRHLKVRLLTMRRVFRCMIKEAYTAEGVMGVLRFWAAMALKAPVNRDKLWNYRRLGLLPDGTLGREYWKHMTEVGFGFPGDIAGIADTVAYHDVGHVLAGHDITPMGEIQQGCFQGGNRREDGFFFIQFVILHFHQGVKITPVADATVGKFHPEKVLWAIHRGAKMHEDITHQWNFWPLMEMPIDKARKKIGLLAPLPV